MKVYMRITYDTYIEEIIKIIPDSVFYLQKKGIKCIACGEAVWGTLKDAADLKKITAQELSVIMSELNEMIEIKQVSTQ
jgi:methionine synthase II (cobalamin-independent)